MIPTMIHLFFMLASFDGRAWLYLFIKPRSPPPIDPLKVRYSPNPSL